MCFWVHVGADSASSSSHIPHPTVSQSHIPQVSSSQAHPTSIPNQPAIRRPAESSRENRMQRETRRKIVSILPLSEPVYRSSKGALGSACPVASTAPACDPLAPSIYPATFCSRFSTASGAASRGRSGLVIHHECHVEYQHGYRDRYNHHQCHTCRTSSTPPSISLSL
jgi:hypothetical protein